MPVCRIEAPPGIGLNAKKKMFEKITSAIDEAYHIGDTLVFLQECSPENVALNGRLLSEDPESERSYKRSVPEPRITSWSTAS